MAINVIVQYNDRSLPDNWLCMAINISVVQYNGGLLPDFILLAQGYYPRGPRLCTNIGPRLLPSGNPFKYHVVALSLQPM